MGGGVVPLHMQRSLGCAQRFPVTSLSSSKRWPTRGDPTRRRGGRCAAWKDGVVSSKPETDMDEVWQRIRLLKRQQDAAVQDEDYGQAAVLRDTLKSTIQGLSIVQQFVISQIELLKSPDPATKRQAIRSIGVTGCGFAIPSLAALLHEEEFRAEAQQAMLESFSNSANPESNDLMRKGESMMVSRDRDLEASLEVFSDLIRKEPTFAEGYNKRATVLYLMNRYEESILDCKTVVRMQPYHFAAYSGMGLCLFCLERYDEAIKAFDAALQINPGLTQIRQVSNQIKRDTQMGDEI